MRIDERLGATSAGLITACVALALPMLLAANLPPSATFLNQVAALVGWGLWLACACPQIGRGAPPHAAARPGAADKPLLLAYAAMLAGVIASVLWRGLPPSLGLSAVGVIAAAALATHCGVHLGSADAASTFRAFTLALVVAATLSSLVGIIQVFVPQWADGNWIARSYIEGRAVGNMRQPNHLSSLMLWGVIAALWLGEAAVWRHRTATALSLLFIFVAVLSASRTGAISMLLLAGWGVLDRGLSRPARRLLWAAPLIYLAFWWTTGLWADATHHAFGGETRFNSGGDVSSSRFGIWSNTLTLIRMHPWIGVGWGEFNFAWTLTPFPHRPVAFFDHTHNIVLQFLVELGLPLGGAVAGLIGYAFSRVARGAWHGMRWLGAGPNPVGVSAPAPRVEPAGFMMLLLILVHSLLEYPLWYAYFLLPAAFVFGLCLARPDAAPSGPPSRPPRVSPRLLAYGGVALALGGLFAVFDYLHVVSIFAPPEPQALALVQRLLGQSPGEPPSTLDERIEMGRRTALFAVQADYAAATVTDSPRDALPAFRNAPHALIDARLLEAWARALADAGDLDRARYLADRLREFRNPQSKAFFEACTAGPADAASVPFQCRPAAHALRFEDFR